MVLDTYKVPHSMSFEVFTAVMFQVVFRVVTPRRVVVGK